MNAVTLHESSALQTHALRPLDLGPKSLEEVLSLSEILAKSTLVPKDFQNKPGNCAIAILWGSELGLKAMQSLQNIAVVNGRPSMWGDALLALVRSSPAFEWISETDDGFQATCRIKRRGEPEQARTFNMKEANEAGLLNKDSPWKTYPKRMRQMRARAFALRDVFADVLRGIPVAEEMFDLPRAPHSHDILPEDAAPMTDTSVTGSNRSAVPNATSLPPATYPDDRFRHYFPTWKASMETGKKSTQDVINMVSTKSPLTEAQLAELRSIPVPGDAPTTDTPTAH